MRHCHSGLPQGLVASGRFSSEKGKTFGKDHHRPGHRDEFYQHDHENELAADRGGSEPITRHLHADRIRTIDPIPRSNPFFT